MNKPERGEQENAHNDSNQSQDSTDMIEARISKVLHDRASRVQFTPTQRAEVMQRLSTRRQFSLRNRLIPAFSLAAALLLILSVATYILITQAIHQPAPIASTIFVTNKTYSTPSELALGGQLVALDPSGQHIVYGVANQAGVMYTTALADPIKYNQLAMRYALDAAWAPDGSALVTTIYPQSVVTPLLALVPTGQYMHTLGKEALAASWLPTSTQTITYITQVGDQTTLWEIGSNGKNAHAIGTMSLPAFIQHLNWSSDGRYLALLATDGSASPHILLQSPSTAIYIFDKQTASIKKLVLPDDASFTNALWAPGGDTLTYVMTDIYGHSTINAISVSTQTTLFTIALKRQLQGMSWSPDGRALIYSDGGTLQSHVIHGSPIQFANIHASASYPLWQDNQHILYLSITNHIGQLTQLVASANH